VRQFILPEGIFVPETGEETAALTGRDYHYIARVLRNKVGDQFPGTDRSGVPCVITIKKIVKSACQVKISPRMKGQNEPGKKQAPSITLFQCLPKGKKMDLIIRQATEAGVERIIPLSSNHSVPVLSEEDGYRKRERWLRISREACQQSGSPILPEISAPVAMKKIKDLLNPGTLSLFFHQDPLENNSLHHYLADYPREIAILIGPEGGLSREEIDLLTQIGFHPVYLGEKVLRTETAALYVLGAVQILLLERQSWSVQ
jgi:16S rRNA (uracil1498-N3)-methyltransferase